MQDHWTRNTLAVYKRDLPLTTFHWVCGWTCEQFAFIQGFLSGHWISASWVTGQ